MGLLPFLIRVGRNKYVEWVQQKANVTEGNISESSRLLSRNGDVKEDEELPTGSERFDIYFAFASFIIDALALVGVGMSKQVWQLYACKSIPSSLRLIINCLKSYGSLEYFSRWRTFHSGSLYTGVFQVHDR
jgi:hypothetical protein